MDLREYIAPDLLEKFEFYSYNHALEIITQAFPAEWSEIVDCLRQLRITTDDLRESGGNETNAFYQGKLVAILEKREELYKPRKVFLTESVLQ